MAECENLLSDLDPASRALLLSQAGPGGSRAITALPTAPELRMPSDCMRVVLLRRLRLPLPHALGDHRAACPVAGVLGPRGAPLERAAARICREGGARVATNVLLRDMNVDEPLADSRRIEVLANGLPLWQGAKVAVDFVSPVSRDGSARAGADRVSGKAAADAGRRKRQTTYPELLASRRCRLVVLAVEVGGRFGAELADFLRRLAASKARAAPARLRQTARQAACHRWAGMLAVSLLELPLAMADECDGTEPPLAEVLADARHAFPVTDSRLPARPQGSAGEAGHTTRTGLVHSESLAGKEPRKKKLDLAGVLALQVAGNREVLEV